MFVCVAFVFWVLLSLDSEVQKDFEIPTEIIDVPENATIIGRVPSKFYVTVQGKGAQLLRFMWGKTTPIKLKFSDNITESGVFSMSRVKIDGKLRDYFGKGIQVTAVKPDSIRLPYTTMPGVALAIKINADVQPNLQCIISGPITSNVDSVKVYGLHGVPRNLSYVETEPINLSGIKDSTSIEVAIKPIEGLRIIPDNVRINIPVEPLISKKRNVPIEVIGTSDKMGIITFPSAIDVSYLVPMSRYNENYPIKAYVDFNQVDSLIPRVAVEISSVPDYYKNLAISPDSVEYVLEKKY